MYPAVRREFSNAHDLLRLTIQSHFEAAKKFELRQMERDEEELRRRSTHTRYDSDGERAALRGRGRQQRGRGGRKSTVLRPPAPPATLLGMIVRVRKSVQEHRSFVKERWDEIQSGRIDPREGKGVWGAVDGEWLAEIVEGEGREKKDAPTPPTVPKKRKADEEEEDDEVLYIEADSDEEPRMALKSKPRPAPTPAAPAGTKGPQNAVLSELLGESYDVLSGDYEMVGKVPVVFDDRRSSGRVVDTLDMQPLPKLRGLEEPRSDEENEEDKPVIITPRRPGNGWE